MNQSPTSQAGPKSPRRGVAFNARDLLLTAVSAF